MVPSPLGPGPGPGPGRFAPVFIRLAYRFCQRSVASYCLAPYSWVPYSGCFTRRGLSGGDPLSVATWLPHPCVGAQGRGVTGGVGKWGGMIVRQSLLL